ncbi:hypothetical protein C5167_014776 [Papaver somniferum]|uniref:Uncharacterized protein n=1 Tax=Papaver somniferum TaxID=3469 RepID=A0A4Y7J7P0_PAPSO|nr:hypothetical protein C5167_014776 [Papaver somniferum]
MAWAECNRLCCSQAKLGIFLIEKPSQSAHARSRAAKLLLT